MIYTTEVQHMCPVAKGAYHGPAPIPEEGKWVQAKEISDISGFTHGVGWCAPQQGACKLTLNIKNGIIEEALVETILRALKAQASCEQWTRDGGAYIPYPATWLNGRRWEDELPGRSESDRGGESREVNGWET